MIKNVQFKLFRPRTSFQYVQGYVNQVTYSSDILLTIKRFIYLYFIFYFKIYLQKIVPEAVFSLHFHLKERKILEYMNNIK